jgi:acetyl/propionyl-CoA carboxylase alpha subunit
VLDPEQEQLVKDAAARLAVAVGYRGAATAEFLYQPDERAFAFLEVNTRLQVEHPVTEITCDVDLVRLQLHVAAGGRLEGPVPPPRGHASRRGSTPRTPTATSRRPRADRAAAPARRPGVRVDTGVGQGDVIPADFDSMIAKVIAYGRPGRRARAAAAALVDTTVVIEGARPTRPSCSTCSAPEVVSGRADTGGSTASAPAAGSSTTGGGVALVAAGSPPTTRPSGSSGALLRHRPRRPARGPARARPAFDLKLRGSTHRVEVSQVGPHRYRVAVDGTAVDAVVEPLQDQTVRLVVEGGPTAW